MVWQMIQYWKKLWTKYAKQVRGYVQLSIFLGRKA
jgi:hypothetical protein